jgi:hypothetical protein
MLRRRTLALAGGVVGAAIVASGIGGASLGATVPAARYLLTTKQLPAGFYLNSVHAVPPKRLNTPAAATLGTCKGRQYVHWTSGAEAGFGVRSSWVGLDQMVALGTTLGGVRTDANMAYAQFVGCGWITIDKVVWTVHATSPMHNISNGARVGVLVLTGRLNGVPLAMGLGIAQRGHAETDLAYGPAVTPRPAPWGTKTLSLTLRAAGRLPRR